MATLALEDFLGGGAGPVRAGDVLAFRGTSEVDLFIQKTSLSGICHVGILVDSDKGEGLSVLEATGVGITLTPLETSLRTYAGQTDHHTCFYLPLADAAAAQVDAGSLRAFAAKNVGQKYNYAGTVAAGLVELENPLATRLVDSLKGHPTLGHFVEIYERARIEFWDRLFELNPGYRRLFCSELVTDALDAAGVRSSPPWPNPRLVVPVQVCRFPIYRDFFQLNDFPPPLAAPFEWGGLAAAQSPNSPSAVSTGRSDSTS
jgi:hypothetical protein